ncbi:MAG: hypothetical protein FWE83_02850 [Oscillospiraceae bacterium]|nr:hypothetical protein [Oscillospiraceae bacterium]
MSNEGIINVSMDENDKWVVSSPLDETGSRNEKIALYKGAQALMEELFKKAAESGELRKHIPGGHFDSSMFEPFSIPFKVISDGSTGTPFEVEFLAKDYTVLNTAFGQIALKEKRKIVTREKKVK